MRKILTIIIASILFTTKILAQVGEYRNKYSIGIGGGYTLNRIGFLPTVTQNMHGGYTCGLTARYTCEKYFSTLCAVQMEVNMTQLGWRERIETIDGAPVINPDAGTVEEYQRDQTYIQIPIFAHLSWGKESNGINGFINLGPQIGINTGEKTKKNYELPFTSKNYPDTYDSQSGRVNAVVAQETMPIENKFDYGIAVGAGIEWHIKHFGRLNLEGRYYYGLGNIYGDSKRDYFGASNHNTIFIKFSYLCDL
jgi:hypothetical protein